AGYLTGMVVKWHLDIGGGKGESKAARVFPAHMPGGQGFDEYWRGELRQFYASHDLKGQPFADAPHVVTDNRFRVVVQTEAALSFLDRRTAKPDQPWFLYLAWFAPHVPLESPEPWFSKVPDTLPKERRQALAMIAAMDDGLGRIREKLRAMNAEKNTLIFFVGDNGAPVKPGHWDGSLNLPLIGEKGMLTDGGIRTPFVAAWPGTLPAGTVYEHPVINLDIAATAVALAGEPHGNLDGVNLMPFLTGGNQAAPHEALYWRWRSQAAVLEFPWKLIHLGPQERFLFNVTSPEGETKNLLAEHADIASRLEQKLATWCTGLKPPGLPTETNEQDFTFFADHVDKRFAAQAKAKAAAPDEPGSVRGWVCRNGTLSLQDGALLVTADTQAKAAPFLTFSKLDLAGPVTISMKVQATTPGAGFVSWRSKQQPDFTPQQKQKFDWPSGEGWQDVKASVPDKARIIHVRIGLPAGAKSLKVQSIQMQDAQGKVQNWDFGVK
ncbi:MAG: sulfatase-like hydrolase/transferase, partial [Acidobacteria bacterium]|nr:sulfatase-like hydrolase/transferase [Acidobacteriota bacterium]